MSEFTNPMSRAAGGSDAYTRAVIELLGDREPYPILESLVERVEALVAGLSDADLRRPEAPGKWSVLEVIHHLADAELAWAWRLRLVLTEERPRLTGYDQDAWAERLHYERQSLDDAMEQLRVLRAANLRLLTRLKPEDLARVGVHAERGEESVEHMVRLYAGHDLVHLRQLDRIRRAMNAG